MAGQNIDINIRAKDNASPVIADLSKRIAELDQGINKLKTDRLGGDVGGLGDAMQGAASGTGLLGGALGKFAGIAAGLATSGVLIGIGSQLKEAYGATAQWADTIDDMTEMLGVSGEDASAWAVAMKHVGLSVQTGEQQLKYFTRQLAQANEQIASGSGETPKLVRALDKLGISAYDSSGNLRDLEELMPEIMDAFKKLPAGVEASGIAIDLFGSGAGSKFLDFLRLGSEGLTTADEKARAFGLSMSTLDANKIEELGRKANDLGMILEGLKYKVGLGLIDPLTSALGLVDQLAFGLGGMTAQPYELKFSVSGLDALGMPTSTMLSGGDLGVKTWDITKTIDQNRLLPTAPVAAPVIPSWVKNIPATTLESLSRLDVAEFQDLARPGAIAQMLAGATPSGGASVSGAAAPSLGFPDYLARAFPDIGSAQGWMGAFSAEHGGRQAGQTDVRDYMASQLFAQKHGRGPTQEEWEARYYKGSFEGMEGEESQLDAYFGKGGTLTTKMDEQRKLDADNYAKLLDAFAKTKDPTYNVTIVGKRLTD